MTLMLFNKMYDKNKPPKTMDLTIDKEKELTLIKMIGESVEPVEQELIIIEKTID